MEDIVIYVVGNKTDLQDRAYKDMKDLREEFINSKLEVKKSYDVSAKLNLNIDDMFKSFYTDVFLNRKDVLYRKSQNFKRLKELKEKKHIVEKKCC